MARFLQGMRGFLENVGYAWQVRKTPYVDNVALKTHYLESRKLYHEKMNSALLHRTNNDLNNAFDELFSAVDYSDTSDLWERKASLAKSINDNRGDVGAALIGTITGYFTSLGMAIPLIPEVYTKGLNVFSSFLFWGLLAVLVFGIYTGSFNQNRLKRLVREHKDYGRESEEIADLLERKRDTRIR
jgi:hypothetical protein